MRTTFGIILISLVSIIVIISAVVIYWNRFDSTFNKMRSLKWDIAENYTIDWNTAWGINWDDNPSWFVYRVDARSVHPWDMDLRYRLWYNVNTGEQKVIEG